MSDVHVFEQLRQEMVKDCLPCPFCGGSAIDVWTTHGWWTISCKECRCQVPSQMLSTLEDAKAAWNRRPASSEQELATDIHNILFSNSNLQAAIFQIESRVDRVLGVAA